jgi:hypothetical protein
MVLLHWVNELAMNDNTCESNLKCIQKGLLGRTRHGWYSRVKRIMGIKVSTVQAWYDV